MTSSTLELHVPTARSVSVSPSTFTFELEDGRSVSAPPDWFPRLMAGTTAEWNNWQLIGTGDGVHWPDLDEDISVEGLLAGRRSMGSLRSIQRWLDERAARGSPA